MQCQYLYHQHKRLTYQNSHRVRNHSHTFWHLDWFREGQGKMFLDFESKDISSGTVILVPSGTNHGFCYEGTTDILSIKFELHNAPKSLQAICVKADSLEESIIHNLEFLVIDKYVAPPVQGIVEHLLSALACSLKARIKTESYSEQSFAGKVIHYIQANINNGLTVDSTATQFGYSVNHFSARFKKETDQSIKQYIDQQRCYEAQKLLRYTDMAISNIADELQFPNVFSFSRFFKRLANDTPGEWRKKNG